MHAFHGSAAVKADLLARLRRHADDGTLLFGATRWDGTRGSPLGVSAESESIDDYTARFGYPLALAGLLDPITAADRDHALANAVSWVDCVEPGRDLSGVPLRIVQDLLERLGARALAAADHDWVVAQHRCEAVGVPVAPAAWRQLRAGIEAAADTAAGPRRTALRACALACWPLATSRSVLVGLVQAWLGGASPPPDPRFDDADRARAQAMLQAIWEETAPRRDAGEAVAIPALFRARDPDLSARFEADLERSNAFHLHRAAQVPALVLNHLAVAGTGDPLPPGAPS